MMQPEANSSATLRQRWNHFLLIIFVLSGALLAVNLKDSVLMANSTFFDPEVGIQARYPTNWLLDGGGDYIFRVRDMARTGFKPTIQVAVQPAGASTSTRTVLDALTLRRSQGLAAYRVLGIEDAYVLPDDSVATTMEYAFAVTEPDPFLQSIPTVVRGLDIVTIRRGQVFVITFLTNTVDYDRDIQVFLRFLDQLRL